MTGVQTCALPIYVPGTTRDVLEQVVEWGGVSFRLVDTGGMFGASRDPLQALVLERGRRAVAEADLLVVIVDGREGLVPADEEVAAAVLLKPGMSVTEDELRTFLLSSIAKFKVPSKIWFRTEPIPRNANGKFLKREVRKELIGE